MFYFREHFHVPQNVLFVGSRLVCCRIGNAEVRDSYAILPVALRKLGSGKKSIDISLLEEESREENKKEIIEYLLADTESLYKAVENWRSQYGNGITLASVAFEQLEKLGYKVPRLSEKYDEKFRKFYFGGRTECFASGVFENVNLKVYEINSAYPYAMANAELWLSNDYTLLFDEEVKGCDLLEVEGIAKGCFPFRENGTLSFPNDGEKRTYCVTGYEFLTARKWMKFQGKILKHFRPLQTGNFSKYVEKFYNLKLQAENEGNETQRMFAKLLLNSVYGKFAINPRRFKEYKIGTLDDDFSNEFELFELDTEAGFSLWQKPNLGKNFLNVATASIVTGYTRAQLFDAICRVEFNGGKIYYCDTDSIITDSELPTGTELGKWKLELDNICNACFAGKKLYALRNIDGKEKIASKGVRANFDQIKLLAEREKVKFSLASPSFSLKKGSATFISRTLQNTNKHK
jgi:hypothetical protein